MSLRSKNIGFFTVRTKTYSDQEKFTVYR